MVSRYRAESSRNSCAVLSIKRWKRITPNGSIANQTYPVLAHARYAASDIQAALTRVTSLGPLFLLSLNRV